MPAPNLQDDRTGNDNLNPSAQNYEGTFNGLQDAEKRAVSNDRKNGDDNNKSIDERENSPSNGIPTIPTTFSGAASKITGKFSGKKKGAIAGIIVFVLGVMGLGATIFTPGLGIIQMKEVLTGNLNDQLAAMDIRSNQVFKAKLSSMSSGICTGVQIKCKFSSMTQKQIDRFKNAGFTIADENVKDGLLGRKIITSMTAPDGTVINNPADLTKARNSSVEVRSAMKRVFNPVYYGLSDKVANTFFTNNKTNKQKKITSGTDEENRKALAAATAGEGAGGNRSVILTEGSGEDARQYVVDENGNKVYSDAGNFESTKAAAEQRLANLESSSEPTAKATSGLLSGAGKGLSVLGAVDSACSVYNLARAVAATAKVARSMQLVQFAMVVNTTADSIKAGDATPEEVEFIGQMLSETDSRERVYDDIQKAEVENPFHGKSAYDSPGYKTAAYNEATTLATQSQQYMVGGGLSGSLSGIIGDVENALGQKGPDALRSTCGVVQNPWVRGIGFIAGIALAVGSFGIGTAVSMAGSIAISFAMPFLEAMLADTVAGNVIGENISGVEAGDAYFAGTSATLGGVAQMRGMQPMSVEGLQQYMAATSESTSDMIALEKYEASKTPFDTAAQYSFLGTFARSLYPTSITAKSSIAGAITSVGSVISQGFASIIKPASAAQAFNPERYSKCNDPGYEELGIDADVFCNVRYGLTPAELALDTIEVVDFMYSSNYISSSGLPQGEYKDFMEFCANREDGWGETSTADGSTVSPELQNGKACIDGSGSTLANISYFRVYTMDKSINEAMDDEIQQEATTELTGKPDGAIDSDRGWRLADGVDYSQYECDPRTTEESVYADPNYGYTIRLCKVDFNGTEGVIASVISTNVMNMLEKARADGVEIGITNGMRKAGTSGYSSYTEHKYGVAMDLATPRSGQTICYGGDPRYGYGSAENAERACRSRGGIHYAAYQWLQQNAETYGIYNYLVEPWHWSSSGR